jgi:hypothetical protein
MSWYADLLATCPTGPGKRWPAIISCNSEPGLVDGVEGSPNVPYDIQLIRVQIHAFASTSPVSLSNSPPQVMAWSQ